MTILTTWSPITVRGCLGLLRSTFFSFAPRFLAKRFQLHALCSRKKGGVVRAPKKVLHKLQFFVELLHGRVCGAVPNTPYEVWLYLLLWRMPMCFSAFVWDIMDVTFSPCSPERLRDLGSFLGSELEFKLEILNKGNRFIWMTNSIFNTYYLCKIEDLWVRSKSDYFKLNQIYREEWEHLQHQKCKIWKYISKEIMI